MSFTCLFPCSEHQVWLSQTANISFASTQQRLKKWTHGHQLSVYLCPHNVVEKYFFPCDVFSTFLVRTSSAKVLCATTDNSVSELVRRKEPQHESKVNGTIGWSRGFSQPAQTVIYGESGCQSTRHLGGPHICLSREDLATDRFGLGAAPSKLL